MEFIVRNVILVNGKAIPPKDVYEEKAAQMLKAKNIINDLKKKKFE